MSDRRLIEEKLPLKEVNAESAREKSLRHGHISTMHLWWARRPLAMSRAVVFGTLLPDPGDKAKRKEILDLHRTGGPIRSQASTACAIERLRELLADAYPDGPPKVLDCFAGGGAIPLEALRLGCDVTAVDLNPVAHLIEKCVLEYPQRFGQPDERRRELAGGRLREVGRLGAEAGRTEAGGGLPRRRERPAARSLLLGAHNAVPQPRLPGRDPAAVFLLAGQ